MVARLKPFMNELVSPQQNVLGGGRVIQDNLVIAHETFHFLKSSQNSKGKELAIKIDMNKTYDRVEWGFLEATLLKRALTTSG